MKRTLSLSGLILAALPTLASAQSPADIVERMLDAYERNTASVENYTVVQEVMGIESELYFEKEMIEGRPVFQLRGSSSAGISSEVEETAMSTRPRGACPVRRSGWGGRRCTS